MAEGGEEFPWINEGGIVLDLYNTTRYAVKGACNALGKQNN